MAQFATGVTVITTRSKDGAFVGFRLLPNARLHVIPGCAHVPQLQSPELFLDMIGGFLQTSRSAA